MWKDIRVLRENSPVRPGDHMAISHDNVLNPGGSERGKYATNGPATQFIYIFKHINSTDNDRA